MTEMPLSVFVLVSTRRLLYDDGQNVPVNRNLISMCGFEPDNLYKYINIHIRIEIEIRKDLEYNIVQRDSVT